MDGLNRLSIAVQIVKDKEVETEDEIKQRQDLRKQIMNIKYLIVGNVDKLNSQMGLLGRDLCSRNALACEEEKRTPNQPAEAITDNRISCGKISSLSNGLPKPIDTNSPKRTSAPRFIETHQCPEFDEKVPNPLPYNISPQKMLGKALRAHCFPGRLATCYPQAEDVISQQQHAALALICSIIHSDNNSVCNVNYIKSCEPDFFQNNISPQKMLGKALRAHCFPGRLPSRPTFNKLLFSLPCQDILKDIFWHRFLSHVQSNTAVQKNLFHRVAKNYVTLMQIARQTYFTDSFFRELPFLLPPAIYASFIHCFGDSLHQFDSAFKEATVQLVWLWMTGINPSPGVWKKWNCKLLEPDAIIISESKLGGKKSETWHLRESENESDLPREQRMKKPSTTGEENRQLTVADHTPVSTASFLPKYFTRKDDFGRDGGRNGEKNFSTAEKKMKTSQNLVRTTFNLNGLCPLVQHFLRAQNAELHAGTITRVQRTQIKSVQPVTKG